MKNSWMNLQTERYTWTDLHTILEIHLDGPTYPILEDLYHSRGPSGRRNFYLNTIHIQEYTKIHIHVNKQYNIYKYKANSTQFAF